MTESKIKGKLFVRYTSPRGNVRHTVSENGYFSEQGAFPATMNYAVLLKLRTMLIEQGVVAEDTWEPLTDDTLTACQILAGHKLVPGFAEDFTIGEHQLRATVVMESDLPHSE